jgi:hypothetical protein
MERCSCDAAAVARYREVNAVLCDANDPNGYLGRLVTAVESGDLVYNPGSADALFARLHDEDAPCVGEPYRALKLDSAEVHSFAGTFVGTPRLGNFCTMPIGEKGGVSDCREGFCLPDPMYTAICGNFVGEGQPCDLDPAPGRSANVCHETTPPDIDGEYATAFRSVVCRATPNGAFPATCVRDLEDGAPCTSQMACASHFCRGEPENLVCAEKSAAGEPCAAHSDCETGACGDDGLCGAPLPDGADCGYENHACTSGFCNDVAGADACAPAPTQAVGEACAASAECISIGSGSSRDRACQDGRCVNDICAEYSE